MVRIVARGPRIFIGESNPAGYPFPYPAEALCQWFVLEYNFPMRREISAGCVIYRREGDETRVVLIRPRDRDAWALPKGLLDPGESSEAAAEREAQEETGLRGKLGSKIDSVKYTYTAKWESPPVKVFKIVTYYLMEFRDGDASQHDWEVESVEWFPIDQAIKLASYPSEKGVLKKAKELLA